MSRITFVYDTHVCLQHTFQFPVGDRTPTEAQGPAIDVSDIGGGRSRVSVSAS
jgi:hypothetical protein